MFERTVRIWHHLVDRLHLRPGGAEAERRARDRFPSSRTVRCWLADTHEAPLTAQVRNISLGGINLLVERPFPPGALLNIELPATEHHSASTALAYVQHVSPYQDGTWALGCTFAQDLEDEELQVFGARRERAPESDARRWVRHACDITATFHVVTDHVEKETPAKVLNISASGIGLLVTQPLESGAVISVQMQGSHGQPPFTMLACVVHVNSPAEGEWALGCNFIRELKENELQALL